jgi:hypothetical protein
VFLGLWRALLKLKGSCVGAVYFCWDGEHPSLKNATLKKRVSQFRTHKKSMRELERSLGLAEEQGNWERGVSKLVGLGVDEGWAESVKIGV